MEQTQQGSLVEFQHSSGIRTQYPGGVRTPRDGGTWNTIAGQPTDDSEMALALARSILRMGRYDAMMRVSPLGVLAGRRPGAPVW